ncbi:hypothetical protein [Aquirhabdus sp.]|uniref:hypothetical protein n=1 Tax=Aquirhabdus sp. TaxID=2824160 RepID=UPI00396C6EE7
MIAYLEALKGYLNKSISIEQLASLEETEVIRAESSKTSSLSISSYEISLTKSTAMQFYNFFKKLYASNSSPVYVWIEYVSDCGVLLIDSILAIREDFDFSPDDNGVIVFTTSDNQDRLSLNFWSNINGEQRLTIEAQGNNWQKVEFSNY